MSPARANQLLLQGFPQPTATAQRIPQYTTPSGAVPPMALSPSQLSAARAQQRAAAGPIMPLEAAAMRGASIPPGPRLAPPAPRPMQTIGDAFRQPLTSPTGQGLAAAALTGLDYAGPQLQPTSIGQGLARMGAAGLQAFTQAKQAEAAAEQAKFDRAYKTADLQIKAAKVQKSGPFAGTSMTAQSMNTLLNLSPKMASGDASPEDEQLYRLAYGYLSKPRVETRETDQGTTTVRVPGQDMSAFHRPEGFAEDEEVIGRTSAKFTEGQSNAAAFANRMSAGLMIFDELSSGGYDPTNLQDYLAGNLPRSVSGFATTAEGQRYMAAKTDFITAVLRKESGAAISVSEFEKEDRKYFPQPGEGPEVVEQKRLARGRALDSMIAQSGPAYEVLFGEAEETGIPPGSQFIKRVGSTSYYRDPNGDIIAVDD
tara:strand:- start:1654 stop:2934 length:1281 start_codon:yes stop_codon:yes gene_type:complete